MEARPEERGGGPVKVGGEDWRFGKGLDFYGDR